MTDTIRLSKWSIGLGVTIFLFLLAQTGGLIWMLGVSHARQSFLITEVRLLREKTEGWYTDADAERDLGVVGQRLDMNDKRDDAQDSEFMLVWARFREIQAVPMSDVDLWGLPGQKVRETQ